MKLASGVTGDAYPPGIETYRHWLLRVWDEDLPMALVIGINPNKATESSDDPMTNFLTRLLKSLAGDYRCGSYCLVNCFDYRDRQPKSLLNVPHPNSEFNDQVIANKLDECAFVVVSWGTTKYGTLFDKRREQLAQLVRNSGKPAICFSPTGAAIYCSQTNANRNDGGWTSTPVLWTSPRKKSNDVA